MIWNNGANGDPWGSMEFLSLSQRKLITKSLFLVNEQLKRSPPLIIEDIEVAHRLPGGTATSPQGQPAATPQRSQGAQQEANNDTLERPSLPRTVKEKFTNRRTNARVMALRKELIEFNPPPDNTDPVINFQDDLTAKLAYQARVLKREKCMGKLEKFRKQWKPTKIKDKICCLMTPDFYIIVLFFADIRLYQVVWMGLLESVLSPVFQQWTEWSMWLMLCRHNNLDQNRKKNHIIYAYCWWKCSQ